MWLMDGLGDYLGSWAGGGMMGDLWIMEAGWVCGLWMDSWVLGRSMVGYVGDQSGGWKGGDLWVDGRMIDIWMLEGWEVVGR